MSTTAITTPVPVLAPQAELVALPVGHHHVVEPAVHNILTQPRFTPAGPREVRRRSRKGTARQARLR
ncbi:hypothetical protein [Micromonospora coerulea]|uniref:hypothetical protein n=1 Tax=Micromonospora coerulea TaxID=47856 RepID=UPI0031FA085F